MRWYDRAALYGVAALLLLTLVLVAIALRGRDTYCAATYAYDGRGSLTGFTEHCGSSPAIASPFSGAIPHAREDLS